MVILAQKKDVGKMFFFCNIFFLRMLLHTPILGQNSGPKNSYYIFNGCKKIFWYQGFFVGPEKSIAGRF